MKTIGSKITDVVPAADLRGADRIALRSGRGAGRRGTGAAGGLRRRCLVADYRERLDEDGQVDFKGEAKAFLRNYGFLSQVLPYTNAE
jgi:hypothetical protein